jgi:hypothetical protein
MLSSIVTDTANHGVAWYHGTGRLPDYPLCTESGVKIEHLYSSFVKVALIRQSKYLSNAKLFIAILLVKRSRVQVG